MNNSSTEVHEPPAVSIAIDAMGGDAGVAVTVPAVLELASEHSTVHFQLVGLKTQLPQPDALPHNVSIVPASEVILMDEPPRAALRYKPDSSMRIALQLVQSNQASVCVSAGNTGALMALAHYILKMLPGITRPAILTQLPTQDSQGIRMLDLGANVSCSGRQLYEFAIIGAAVARTAGINLPKVALLNVGHETIKGNDQVKEANQQLEGSQGFEYLGYVEGSEIFSGKADVIVCDGFVGNIVLKSCEGMLKSLRDCLVKDCRKSVFKSLAMGWVKYLFRKTFIHFHPDHHNGALLAGLKGLVVKSHGNANIVAFKNAILTALSFIQSDELIQIDSQVADLLKLNKESKCLHD